MTTATPNPPTGAERSTRRLDLLLDVPLDLTVELGRSRMSIQDLLSLGPGSVIELDKVAGEPLDILVNDRLIARGEAVVVNDKFGIRITDIVSPTERIARLR
jgi:flagellar motor switch protein FliN/FliY